MPPLRLNSSALVQALPTPARPKPTQPHNQSGFNHARNLPGVRFEATSTAIAEDINHYPFHGQTIGAVHPVITDRSVVNASQMGIEILAALHHLYPQQFALSKASRLVANADTMAALERGDTPSAIIARWQLRLEEFRSRRALYLLYP